jgi:DNA-directed RNA polymerase subunit E'
VFRSIDSRASEVITLFSLITVKDVVRIPPEKFGQQLEGVAREELNGKYEGMVSKQFGFIIAVTDVKVNYLGKIIPGDGATYHAVFFTLLSYTPSVQEIVEGEVVEIEDFGAFIRIGPIDALLHVSQVIDDFISYNQRQSALYARETGRILQQNDVVRARITVVSFTKGKASGKIGLTTRQPFLGKIDWIIDDVKKIKTPSIEQKGS